MPSNEFIFMNLGKINIYEFLECRDIHCHSGIKSYVIGFEQECTTKSSIVPVTAVTRVQARLMIFTMCGAAQVTP